MNPTLLAHIRLEPHDGSACRYCKIVKNFMRRFNRGEHRLRLFKRRPFWALPNPTKEEELVLRHFVTYNMDGIVFQRFVDAGWLDQDMPTGLDLTAEELYNV